jgi:alpha-D-ribose 1-methylphosphonate 5-triphosphate synthase subunit PhnI
MKVAKFLLFPLLALALSGCAGYRLGSALPAEIRTVSLEVINKTEEPSIEVAVKKALLAELQMDGRLEVRLADEADADLTVTLTGYELSPTAFNRKQGTLAEEYLVTLRASAVLRDAESGEVILEAPLLEGDADFPFSHDLTSAKRQALPAASADLARKTVALTAVGW